MNSHSSARGSGGGRDRAEAHEPSEVLTQVLRHFVPVARSYGFTVESLSAQDIILMRRYLPAWAVALGGLLLPLGVLVWLFYRRTQELVVHVSRTTDGCSILFVGDSPRGLEKWIRSIQA